MPGRKASEAVRRDQITRAAYEVASQQGLDRLTVRLVAARAHLSPGLVLFHFKSKERLVIALLDGVLATTTVLRIGPEIRRIRAPLKRLLALLRVEMNRLSSEPRRIRLFFDFWALGRRQPAVGARIRAELTRYRAAFRPIAREVLKAEPERFPGVTPAGLAAVAVSFIKGCAVQSMIDPEHFDIREYLLAAEGLLGQLAPSGRAAPAAQAAAGGSTSRRATRVRIE